MTRALETGWLDDTPVDDNLLRRFLHNQADLSMLLARAAGGDALEQPDLVASWYDTDVRYNNMAVPLRPLDSALLDAVDAFYAGRSHGATLLSAWPAPDLSARGWQLMGHPMFVVRSPGRMPLAGRPGVTLDVAGSAADLALGERLAIEGYPLPCEAPANSVYAAPLLDSRLLVRIGRVDGEPVSVAASHPARGVQNLCLAATLPAARRRGVWAQLVAARVNDAPELPAVAVTSDDSRPGFTRLGFLPVQRMTMWMRN